MEHSAMAQLARTVINAIDTAKLNRGLRGIEWLNTKGNVACVSGEDVVLFDYEGEGTYEGHVLMKSRGRDALETARKALNHIFEQHEAVLVFALVPLFRKDANIFVRWLGMNYQGDQETSEGPCALFTLSASSWKRANQCHS